MKLRMMKPMKIRCCLFQKFEERYSSDGQLLQHENAAVSPKDEEDFDGDPVKVVSIDANL